MGFEDQEPGAAGQRPMSAEEHPNYAAQVEREEQQKRDDDAARHAEFNAHPHTRLTALAADLGTKRVDLHDRIGALHRVLAGVIGLALTHTPPPRQEKTDGQGWQDESARGS